MIGFGEEKIEVDTSQVTLLTLTPIMIMVRHLAMNIYGSENTHTHIQWRA